MRILMAASEMAPLARTGGVAEVLEALPAELEKRGHEVSVVLPFYRGIRENRALKIATTGVRMMVEVGSRRIEAEIMETIAPSGVQIFLVKRDEFFDGSELYKAEGNAERFAFFCKAVVGLARRLDPAPDILHLHDWQTALAPVFAVEAGLRLKIVLTIHQLAEQGSFPGSDFGLTNLPSHYFGTKGVEFYGRLNFLKTGILFADAITTVSEQYAREMQTPEYGGGLDAVIREHAPKLTGILNGADYARWNPASDPSIPKKYKPGALAGKKACRSALLETLGLEANPRGQVFAMVARLAEEKGFDLLLPLLDRLLADDVRLVILGEGDPRYERELFVALKRHAGRFAFRKDFDEKLAHGIEAGADVTLVPSRLEPSGLSAMHSLKYGTIPLSRASGGWPQIVRDYDPSSASGNGFLFYANRPEALWDTIGRAKKVFAAADEWKALMLRAMDCNFSWQKSAEAYEEIYMRISPA